MKSLFEVLCIVCGGSLHTRKDAHQSSTDANGHSTHWHLPVCPLKGEQNESITLQRTVAAARNVC